MKNLLVTLLMAALVVGGYVLYQSRVAGPVEPRVFIIEPADGATVTGEFVVRFGIEGMTVAPAGTVAEGTGHHHLLIDLDAMPDLSRPLPATDRIVHFGKGQTETTLTLAPGAHTLQLLLADYAHVPHDPPILSEEISIEVE